MAKTYNPKKVAIICGSFAMSGFADGEMVSIAFDEDQWDLKVGTDGEGTRAKSNNTAATVKIMLMQSSDSNPILQAFWASDQASDGGIFPFLMKDNSGKTLYVADQMWIQKQPESKMGKTAESREWTLRTDKMVPYEGGN
jgi:hypothetical protein